LETSCRDNTNFGTLVRGPTGGCVRKRIQCGWFDMVCFPQRSFSRGLACSRFQVTLQSMVRVPVKRPSLRRRWVRTPKRCLQMWLVWTTARSRDCLIAASSNHPLSRVDEPLPEDSFWHGSEVLDRPVNLSPENGVDFFRMTFCVLTGKLTVSGEALWDAPRALKRACRKSDAFWYPSQGAF